LATSFIYALYYTLADYPHATVEIECAKCGRHGRLRTSRLLAEHGPDIKLPDLLGVIAQCTGRNLCFRAARPDKRPARLPPAS